MTQANSSPALTGTPRSAGRRRLLMAFGVGMTLTLSGCGFQLRGVDSAPMAITQLDVNSSNSETHRTLREALERADIDLSDNAPLKLNLGKVSEKVHQITWGDAGSIKRELTYHLVYSVQRKSDGAYLANQQELEANSYYYTNDDSLLNSDEVRERAGQENNSELSRQLLERLHTIKP
ncbi:LPS-assembly lipoprotein LptE [Cobetia sp. L2A1]|uniref:LPS-assembly lipoprotein LptE n=1 Tax=Cobetia sp. L2A1 TaxID=2686360 RepID=UPI00131B09CD|nr:hypothetical protein [Cobetia sp. L2A1]